MYDILLIVLYASLVSGSSVFECFRMFGYPLSGLKAGVFCLGCTHLYQATKPEAYWIYFHLVFYATPIGFVMALLKRTDARWFLIFYTVLAAYFSRKMVRLILILGPAAAICAGMMIAFIFEWAMEQFTVVDFPEEEEEEAEATTPSSAVKKGMKTSVTPAGGKKKTPKKEEKKVRIHAVKSIPACGLTSLFCKYLPTSDGNVSYLVGRQFPLPWSCVEAPTRVVIASADVHRQATHTGRSSSSSERTSMTYWSLK